MDNELNRAKILWQNWEKIEQDLASIEEITEEHPRDITQQKYEFLRAGLYRLGDKPELYEKPYLALMNAVCDKLQRQLYQSPVIRFLQLVKGELFDRPRIVKAHQVLIAGNLSVLKQHFQSQGLQAIAQKLEQHLDYERDTLMFHVSAQMDSERTVTINVHFEKDGEGGYQIGHTDLSLNGLGDPAGDVSILLKKEHQLNRIQQVNLLQGRPIYLPPDKQTESMGIWLQLGRMELYNEYKLLVYESDYGFNLKEELDKLALSSGLPRLDVREALFQLQQGNSFALTGHHPKDEPFLVYAHPAKRGILVTDLQGQEISKESLLQSLKYDSQEQSKTVPFSFFLDKDEGKIIDAGQEQSL